MADPVAQGLRPEAAAAYQARAVSHCQSRDLVFVLGRFLRLL